MKKIVFATFIILLFSCSSKPWNKEAAKTWCMNDNKKHIDDGTVTDEEANKICDCIAEKMFTKYKSEKEINADKYNQMIVGKECIESMEINK